MDNLFSELGISPPILEALEDMGFESPTEVQTQAIPHVLQGQDVIVISKTGSGKTAVYGVPLLQMTDPGIVEPQGLILTPTRELAVQVDSDLKRMAKHLPHRTTAVYGQHSMNVELQALHKGVSIVTGTPGRVYDHISHGNLKMRNIRFLVLDEADRMLDIGFFDQVRQIIKTVPRNRVTLLFSATMPPEVRKLCRENMKSPVTIEIESSTKTVDTTEQEYYRVQDNQKNTSLDRLLLLERPDSCLIFCNQRNTVDMLQRYLDRKGYASQALHGDIPQVKRLKTIGQFKEGAFNILVATDVAARGIHIDELSLVINYDFPLEKDAYIHRIGRTGRAGSGGKAVTLVTSEQIMSLYEMEEHIGAMIPEAEFPTGQISDYDKAAIEKWLQMNAEKRKKLEASSPHPPAAANRPRKSQSNPNQQDRRREQPSGRPAGQKSPAKSAPRVDAKPAQSPPKPVQAPPKPVQAPPKPAPVQAETKGQQPKTVPDKLYKRVLNRFLGPRQG